MVLASIKSLEVLRNYEVDDDFVACKTANQNSNWEYTWCTDEPMLQLDIFFGIIITSKYEYTSIWQVVLVGLFPYCNLFPGGYFKWEIAY